MLNKLRNSGKQRIRLTAEIIVLILIKWFRLDSKKIFYECNGILKYRDHESGEKWFIKHILASLLSDVNKPVSVDIGANIGKYSIELAKAIPSIRCYALEPNPYAYNHLVKNTSSYSGINCLNIGVDASKKEALLYAKDSDLGNSELATLHPESLLEFRGYDQMVTIKASFDSLDNLQKNELIPSSGISFIKIDTEGHELQCLIGAKSLLLNNQLRVIQFEFNDIHVVSKTFLKDFYDILFPAFKLFRLDTSRLIQLGDYDSSIEIFKYQNIIAIRHQYTSLVSHFFA